MAVRVEQNGRITQTTFTLRGTEAAGKCANPNCPCGDQCKCGANCKCAEGKCNCAAVGKTCPGGCAQKPNCGKDSSGQCKAAATPAKAGASARCGRGNGPCGAGACGRQ